ncbi:exodeoxyribonuclease V subunit beta [Spirochaetota bacterium]
MKHMDLLKCPLSAANLIEASAGTGKTYTIAGLYLRLLLEKGFLVSQILVVTFTIAATDELRNRIRNLIRNALLGITEKEAPHPGDLFLCSIVSRYRGDGTAVERLTLALRSFDESCIFTIHSFCMQALSENAFESGSPFEREFTADEDKLLSRIVDDFWRINFYNENPLLIQYIISSIDNTQLLGLLKKQLKDPLFDIVPKITKIKTGTLVNSLESLALFLGKLAKAWEKNKADIEKIFDDCINEKSINLRNYPVKSIKKWTESLSSFLSTGDIFGKFEQRNKFTTTSIIDSTNKGHEPRIHGFFDQWEEFLNEREKLTGLLEKYVLKIKIDLLKYTGIELQKRKKEMNIISFNDLIENMHSALKGPGRKALVKAITGKFRAALIDEFQDTDSVQYDIFTAIFNSPESILFIIGDPKQAIYGFRGADVFSYIKASSNTKSRYTLGTNFRSSSELIKAVNTIFKKARNPFVFGDKKISFNEVGPSPDADKFKLTVDGKSEPPMNIWFINRDYATMKNDIISKGAAEAIVSGEVASEISRLLRLGREKKALIDGEPVEPRHIAVLVRANYQAGVIQQSLGELSIPSVLYGSDSIFKSGEAAELKIIMGAIIDPSMGGLIKAALVTDFFGYSGDDLFKLIKDEDSWEEILNSFYEYSRIWLNHGFMAMARFILKDRDMRARFLSMPQGERRITNLLHIFEVLHSAESQDKLGMEGLLKWFGEKLEDGVASEESEIRLETDDDAVKLITIHRSKGLEYPIVFCPFMWGNSDVSSKDVFSFHDPGSDDRPTLDIGSGDSNNLRIAGREQLAENVRLMYVALTRAKSRCYFTWGKINETGTSALAYILHQPEGLDMEDPLAGLSEHMGRISYEDMVSDLKGLAEESSGTVKLSFLEESPSTPMPKSSLENVDLSFRKFAGYIPDNWKIASYSSLISGVEYDAEEYFQELEEKPSEVEVLHGDEKSIFKFHRGARAGTCIHEIFEDIDFQDYDDIDGVVSGKLSRYGFEETWKDVLKNMVHKVLSTPLDDSKSLTLKTLKRSDRLNELEFYFPLEKIYSQGLSEIFKANGSSDMAMGFYRNIEKLGFSPVRGFLKGYIDLVFHANGKYYLVDWKSNHLGNDISDYDFNAINASMREHYYTLQYHIYTVALDNYLRLRIGDSYNYNENFGGVFYIYTRGVDPGHGNDYGIFYDLPDSGLISKLSEYLTGPLIK